MVIERLKELKIEPAMNDWVYAAEDNDLKEGEMRAAYPLGIHILLARVNKTVYALSGKCLHMACPLYTGTLNGDILTCPCHDWQYNIRTGQFVNAPELNLVTYNLKSEEGKLFIDLQTIESS